MESLFRMKEREMKYRKEQFFSPETVRNFIEGQVWKEIDATLQERKEELMNDLLDPEMTSGMDSIHVIRGRITEIEYFYSIINDLDKQPEKESEV